MPRSSEPAKRILQEYLQALEEVSSKESEPARARHLLSSWAEFSFRMQGGSRCAICRAHVRHVLPVRVVHLDGSETVHDCLCARCQIAERAGAKSVEIGMGETHWDLDDRGR